MLDINEGELSLFAIFYYFLHRKALKNKDCLARVWLTKGTSKYFAKNIIESIDAIFFNAYTIRIEREGKVTLRASPLFILEEGDKVFSNISLNYQTYYYDGEKLIYKAV